MALDPFDLGLEDVSRYPTCLACRKKSVSAVVVILVGGTTSYLCGTHYDEWRLSPELCESPPYYPPSVRFAAFVERLRRERYAACWAVKEEKGELP